MIGIAREKSVVNQINTLGNNTNRYMQTDLGVIPTDWSILHVSQVSEVRRGAASNIIRYCDESSGIRFIRINDFFENKPVFVAPTEDMMRFCLDERDILFAGTGNTAGASFLPRREWLGLPHSYNAPRIRIKTDYSKEYVYQSFQSSYMERQHKAQFVGAAQPFLDTKAISGFFICVPNSIKEQTAIANALSDVDALIQELEKLIAKKQAIKTATMQQLLTGRTRLPQFAFHPDGRKKGYKPSELGEIPEDWETCSLGGLTKYIGSGKTNTQSEGQYPLYGSTGLIGSCKQPEYEGESILVARVGANAGQLNFVKGSYGVSDNTIIIKLNSNSDIQFFKYCLIRRNLNTLVFGSGQPLITGSQLKNISLPTPSKIEQSAIALILSDMDQEVQAIEQNLNKTRQIKQGMMQELLTGKTRLVKPVGDPIDAH